MSVSQSCSFYVDEKKRQIIMLILHHCFPYMHCNCVLNFDLPISTNQTYISVLTSILTISRLNKIRILEPSVPLFSVDNLFKSRSKQTTFVTYGVLERKKYYCQY